MMKALIPDQLTNFLKYSLLHIAGIVGSSAVVADTEIEYLLLDSRKVYSPATSLFFALKGPRRDGHQFIPELYKKGVRSFVVSEEQDKAAYPGAGFIIVGDTLDALQQLAIYHRSQFTHTGYWHYRQQWKNDRQRMAVSTAYMMSTILSAVPKVITHR